MTVTRQKLGRDAERLAERTLVKAGYRILARNYRVPAGEIDLIAEEGDTLVFVEVKARRSHRFGLPQEAVNPAKQRKICRVALAFQRSAGRASQGARFDVVSVNYLSSGLKVEIIRDAFEFIW